MAQNDDYVYRPLRHDGKEIRLLQLLPGQFQDPVRMCIEHTLLDESTRPYEALSYVWGSSEKVSSILVYEQQQRRRRRKVRTAASRKSCSLPITHNLAQALPYLRDKHLSRWLWIDAISINQKDVAERNIQVQHMYGIYESASCTLVWLGAAADDSTYVIASLGSIGANVVCNVFTSAMEYRNEALQAIAEMMNVREREMLLSRLYKAALALVRRDWFSRLWVLQEVIASQKAVAICGFDSIHWDHLLNAYNFLYSMAGRAGHGQFPIKEIVPKIDSFQQSASKCDFFLFQKMASQHDCEDPRDRVYSLRGLAEKSDVKSLLVTVDYDIPVQQLFKTVLLREIENTRRLNFFAQWNTSDVSKKSQHSKPSWLGGWTHPVGSGATFQTVFQSAADAMARCNTVSLPGDILRTSGISISNVEKIAQMSNSADASLENRTRELCDLWTTLRPKGCIDDSPNDLFCQALLSGLPLHEALDTERSSGFIPSFRSFRLLLRELGAMDIEALQIFVTPQINDTEDTVEKMMYLNHVLARLEGFSVFVLRNGFFGIGSFGMRVGDQIVVLLGCYLPMALRSAPPPPASGFEIVGPTYMYELEHGQALLGPLPSHAVFTTSLSKDNRVTNEYKDIRTGESINDPRLHIEDLEIAIVDGEEQYLGPDRQYFLKHGVALEDFDLI